MDGQVTLNYSTRIRNLDSGRNSLCSPHRATEIPAGLTLADEGVGYWDSAVPAHTGSVSGTRTFDISADQTVIYSIACEESGGDGGVGGRTATAIFTPAP